MIDIKKLNELKKIIFIIFSEIGKKSFEFHAISISADIKPGFTLSPGGLKFGVSNK